MLFAGKKGLITGAASGIGRATAIKFAAEGADLVIADRNREGLEETAGLMARAPIIQHYDATDYTSCRALVEVAAKDGLDIVCNIAGLLKWGPSQDFSVEDFDLLMQINASSVFVICQSAIPHLIKSKGVIVNTASTAALQGQPFNIGYSASKHAVAAITKGLAIEYASTGVRINAICPGHVITPMTQNTLPPEGVDWALMMRNSPKLLDGSCEPEDIAEMFVFLASDKSRKATGALFTIDGGQMAG
jgi:meso-butanediol dehydrogenase / (S,S)-butanediol dehydrogenase / diacetyl reductase